MSKYFLSLLIFTVFLSASGQMDCRHRVVVKVVDQNTGRGLSDAFVVFQRSGWRSEQMVSDHAGVAEFSGICRGSYHYLITHAGCKPLTGAFTIHGDTAFTAVLTHSIIELPEVTIIGEGWKAADYRLKNIRPEVVERQSYKPIADIATSIPGVQVLRTGGNISKPIIRGMNAQRIAVLNHGMVQAGQQWGNDHAPEISAFIYDSVSVVRGISPVQMAAGHLGGALWAGKSSTFADEHWHGGYAAGFQSNGKGHWQHLRMDKGNDNGGGVRMDIAYKRSGDLRTPHYFMRNTGMSEWSAGLLWKKQLSALFTNTLNIDIYSAKIGILRGAHIGNVEDLKQAMNRAVPFFTQSSFSNLIDLPRQEVSHIVVSNKSALLLSDEGVLKAHLGFQLNDRKEFDFRRSGENDRPALSLDQWQLFGEVVYQRKQSMMGVQYIITDNTNSPETGILPLIPDYLSHRVGAFYSGQVKVAKKEVAWGMRFDRVYYQAFPIKRSIPIEVKEDVRNYHGITINSTVSLVKNKTYRIDYEIQLTYRIPDINELFSFGLHQGVAGIEEGNPFLRPEKGFQHHLNSLVKVGKLHVRTDGYWYLIRDFINLEPTGELRSTIRGAFPVFAYRQYDLSMLAGVDAIGEYPVSDRIGFELQSSFLYAQHLSEGQPIAWMPANRLNAGIRVKLPDGKRIKSGEWQVQVLMIDRQRRVLESQDFLPPPAGYILLNSGIDFTIPLKKNFLNITMQVENLLNKRYRDFLNRWKYFSDDLGRNMTISIRYKF